MKINAKISFFIKRMTLFTAYSFLYLPLTPIRILPLVLACFLPLTSYLLPFASAAHLIGGTLEALDSGGINRTPAIFNNSERIGFRYSVTNTQSATSDIVFTFTLSDPGGVTVLTQTGNAISGTQVGEGGSSIVGIGIGLFYSVPGNYLLKGEAKFSDGSETVSSTLEIQIFSPLLNLTYPPNNTLNLADNPIIFRWIGTGATKYKFTIADNPTLFNPMLTAEVFETQYSYPTNPDDTRQRLSAGQVYYWSVAGLDTSGTQTSEAAYPFSFTIQSGGTQPGTRDLDIIALELSALPSPSASQAMIDVTVKNNGGRPESSIIVSVYVTGELQDSKSIDSLNVAEEKTITFAVNIPSNRTGSGFFVSAVLDGYTDDDSENSRIKRIPWPEDTNIAKAKILGSVYIGTSKAGEGVVVSYDGPVKGMVTTNSGGEYKIEDLPLGDYSLKAKHTDYPESEALIVAVTESKSFGNKNLNIVTSAAASSVAASTTTAKKDEKEEKKETKKEDKEKKDKERKEAREKVKEAVIKAVPATVANELKGYQLQSVSAEGLSESEVSEILNGLADGTVKVLSAVVE